MNTTIVAVGENQLQINETGHYEVNLEDGQCIADARRFSTLTRIVESPATAATPVSTPTPAATPTPPPPRPSVDCSSPGDPARLEVRPSRKLIRTGETFAFRATVRDSRGCATNTQTQWRTEGGAPITVDGHGKVAVAPDATEGTYAITVAAAGRSTKVSIEVASPSRYEQLLRGEQSEFNAEGEGAEAAVALIGSESVGGGDAQAKDTARKRRTVFIVVVSVLAAILGIVAIIGALRSRKAKKIAKAAEDRHQERVRAFEERTRERQDVHDRQMRAHLESVAKAQEVMASAGRSGPLICPSCRSEYPVGSVFCPRDSNRLVTIQGHENLLGGPAGGVCPVCARGYNPGVTVCPQHGEELIPHAMYAARNPAPTASRGKICPTCGGRFEGTASFCGNDGTTLVLLN